MEVMCVVTEVMERNKHIFYVSCPVLRGTRWRSWL